MEIKPVKKISISEQIFEQLKEKIIRGEFKPNDKLPSENELCRLFKVSRTTIRQALINLQVLGLIETRNGEGSFVKEFDSAIMLNSLIPSSFLNTKSLKEIIEFRQFVEPSVAFLACKKVSNEGINALKKIYNSMVSNKDNLEEFSKLDYEFHMEIAKICQNSYVIKLYEIIHDILLSAFQDIVSKRGNEAGLKYHGLLLESFIKKDASKTKEYMQQHMDDLFEAYAKL